MDTDELRDKGYFLELPSETVLKSCYRQFYEATSNAAPEHIICAVCARKRGCRLDSVSKFGLNDIPSPTRLVPDQPHPNHTLFQGMLLALEGVIRQEGRCQSHSTLWLPTCYERLLVLSNPCWTLPVGCSLVHRGRVESTINLYPAKGKVMVMSAATTSLEWPD